MSWRLKPNFLQTKAELFPKIVIILITVYSLLIVFLAQAEQVFIQFCAASCGAFHMCISFLWSALKIAIGLDGGKTRLRA